MYVWWWRWRRRPWTDFTYFIDYNYYVFDHNDDIVFDYDYYIIYDYYDKQHYDHFKHNDHDILHNHDYGTY